MQAQNTLKTFPTPQVSQRRAIGIGFVMLLHVALIYALLNGLGAVIVKAIKPPERITLVDIPAPQPPKPIPQPPKPPPTPTRVFVPTPPVPLPPGSGENAVTATFEPQPPVLTPISEPVRSIASTHTIPDYPPISRRLNEEGVVSLRIVVSETGAVSGVAVVRSSGYARLDAAAASWVKAHWRYQPAMRNGQPVASTAEARVQFELN